jgi:hypothetical protein
MVKMDGKRSSCGNFVQRAFIKEEEEEEDEDEEEEEEEEEGKNNTND